MPEAEEKVVSQNSAVEDDYELALDDDVLDETLLEQPSDISFAITSYGADYTVDTIIKRLKSEAFYVPPFQRRFVWSLRHASRFIESLLMGLPVPGIFLYKEPITNRHLVVDGQQRLRTLKYFYEGLFGERKFRLNGVRAEWENKTYEDLASPDRLKLDDSIVHATIFQQDEPKDSNRSLYFVFERINSGGLRLSPQEIRNCINDGPLMEAIRVANDDEYWRRSFGGKNNRLKDEELILRFMAMVMRRDVYTRPMRDFLNTFAADMEKADSATLLGLRDTFSAAIKMCWEAKGKVAFRPSRVLNVAVYESVMIGVALRLQQQPAPTPQAVAKAYDELLADKVFVRACERATADDETVKSRQALSIAAFAGV